MKRLTVTCLVASLFVYALTGPAVSLAQSRPESLTADDPQSAAAAARDAEQDPVQTPPDPSSFRRDQAAPEIKPYDKVITKDAKSDPGVFTVHHIKEKVYYEIPKSELGKEFLWVSQIARTTLGVGYGGQAAGNRVVKWERHNNRVLLRSVIFDVVADTKPPHAMTASSKWLKGAG